MSASATAASAASRVLYRGPPGLKKAIYYFIGTVFTGAGCYQGFLLTQHLSWPIFTRDPEKTKLAPPMLRYTAGTAVAVTAVGLGMFFFWTPSRLATRVTLYPATSQIGIRTAAPPFRAFLPPSMRSRRSAPLNPKDQSERFHPLDALYRRDRTSAVEIEKFAQGKGRRVASASSSKRQKVPSSLLLGEDVTFGYQLEAAPTPLFETNAKNLYTQYWSRFKLSLRGETDWSRVAGEHELTPAERTAKSQLHPKNPWFLDRKNFDNLFPARTYGSKSQ
ncbi:hypothetical protein NDA11_003582 [Ustilago hordei]|uniref:Uncharacterized protein n=1 Tax=Ustilago hordei TaxID=120017 RepID=Q2A750_USTHO|nr:hypothetical protein NDA10_002196 [Ustilago hordei]KAJ1570762.1 hypothetical protein NDA11_003582 [Ustilago hordei]KAJ1587469.1 hypothetical protein NDA15_005816 [Ustilago hordei]KAJ1589984.1 hypothetical protein NDA12_002769 [Ustilago hordei]UTT96646.1 hypothetical protein NDA17_006221 [Ustilago hordei]